MRDELRGREQEEEPWREEVFAQELAAAFMAASILSGSNFDVRPGTWRASRFWRPTSLRGMPASCCHSLVAQLSRASLFLLHFFPAADPLSRVRPLCVGSREKVEEKEEEEQVNEEEAAAAVDACLLPWPAALTRRVEEMEATRDARAGASLASGGAKGLGFRV